MSLNTIYMKKYNKNNCNKNNGNNKLLNCDNNKLLNCDNNKLLNCHNNKLLDYESNINSIYIKRLLDIMFVKRFALPSTKDNSNKFFGNNYNHISCFLYWKFIWFEDG
jgi:hypothetical protein